MGEYVLGHDDVWRSKATGEPVDPDTQARLTFGRLVRNGGGPSLAPGWEFVGLDDLVTLDAARSDLDVSAREVRSLVGEGNLTQAVFVDRTGVTVGVTRSSVGREKQWQWSATDRDRIQRQSARTDRVLGEVLFGFLSHWHP